MTRTTLHRRVALGAWLLAMPAGAQSTRVATTAHDSISYREFLTLASNADPRRQQLALQETATALRLRSIAAERLPSLSVDAQGQYQSAVTSIPITLPGVSIPIPPHDTYDAHLGAEQVLLDPTLDSRRELERARLAESRAQIRTTLYGLRQEVTEAFFTAAALRERMAETDASIADLTARLREMVQRFREGTALRADTSSLAATRDERRQDRLALAADRAAALARLALLTGRPIGDSAVLVPPVTTRLVGDIIRAIDTLHARPEYEQFAAIRERLAQQSRLASVQDLPRISAFGRAGYGRPGLDLLSRDFQTYWLVGVQAHWTPIRWGTTERDRQLLEVEREIVTTNESALTRSLERAVQPMLATIAQLDSALAIDEHVIALREQVAGDARAQLKESVITAATYVDRSTELLTARLRRVQHRVALEQARATLLNTLGVEVP
jgi:outer membrane protein TolC